MLEKTFFVVEEGVQRNHLSLQICAFAIDVENSFLLTATPVDALAEGVLTGLGGFPLSHYIIGVPASSLHGLCQLSINM